MLILDGFLLVKGTENKLSLKIKHIDSPVYASLSYPNYPLKCPFAFIVSHQYRLSTFEINTMSRSR